MQTKVFSVMFRRQRCLLGKSLHLALAILMLFLFGTPALAEISADRFSVSPFTSSAAPCRSTPIPCS